MKQSMSTSSYSSIRMRRQRGFSLIEALVGFLILSTGMLGIASLQAISLKSGKSSVYNSVSMMKVDQLLESMRANPTALGSYEGAGANNNCTGTKNCSAAELAADDVYWWQQDMKAGLPGSDVTTTVNVTPAVAPSRLAQVQVKIAWKERNKSASGSVDRDYEVTADICTQVPC